MITIGMTPESVSPHAGAPSKSLTPEEALRSVTLRGSRSIALSRGCSTMIAGLVAELARLKIKYGNVSVFDEQPSVLIVDPSEQTLHFVVANQ